MLNLFRSIKGQYRFEFLMRCSHVLMFGFRVVINANNIFGDGNCLF